MPGYIKYSIDVSYTDNSYGKSEDKVKTFTTSAEKPHIEDMFKEIYQWRYDNGYVLKTELVNSACVPSQGTT